MTYLFSIYDTIGIYFSAPESPIINTVIPERNSGSDSSSNSTPISPVSPISAKSLHNGSSTLPRIRTSTDPTRRNRDSNHSLPTQEAYRIPSLPKSQSEVNMNKVLQTSQSQEDTNSLDKQESERQNYKKKRTFLKLFSRKQKSSASWS